MGLQTFDERLTELGEINILAANTTVAVASNLTTGVSRRIDIALIENTDSIAHDVEVISTINAIDCVWGQVTVPAGAGTVAVPTFDLIAALAPSPLGALFAGNGGAFKLRCLVAVTGAFHVRALLVTGQIT